MYVALQEVTCCGAWLQDKSFFILLHCLCHLQDQLLFILLHCLCQLQTFSIQSALLFVSVTNSSFYSILLPVSGILSLLTSIIFSPPKPLKLC